MNLKNLGDYALDLSACVRCGACQARCPTYLASGREEAVARGKLALATAILAGRAEFDEATGEALSQCLLCGACVHSCPNQVPTDAIVAALRRDIGKKKGLGAVGRGVAALTGNPRLLGGLVRGAGLLEPLLFRKVPETSGLHLRFAPQDLQGRLVPPPPRRNLFARLPERLPGQAHKPTLAFFAGCTITHLYPEMGEAAVRLLHRLGYTVLVPRGQGCCGMPALSSGNGALVERLLRTNVDAFAETPVDWIITACASCGGALGRFYRELQDEVPRDFADKVLDIHVFLKQQGCLESLAALPGATRRVRVCYHDPCHLKNHGIVREPRELLQALPNVAYVEMEGAAACCGLGGTFSVTRPAMSRRIAEAKVPGLAASGADLVASACPGCILQLNDIIHRAGLNMRAVHTVSLALAALDDHPADTPAATADRSA